MDISENERLQEFFLMIGDKLAPIKKIWWYALLAAVVLAFPIYLVSKGFFATVFLHGYSGPKIIYTAVVKDPLQVIDRGVFAFPNQMYGGYVKIKNLNLEWGVASQAYHVQFKTFGGTVLNSLSGTTYILPASEKLIVLPRFESNTKPDTIEIQLDETHFIHKPDITLNFEVQRTNLQNNSNGLVVSSAFLNQSPFTISKVDLPVAVYNNQNHIVAVNFTYINDTKSSETRTFQYSWPASVSGAVRAEINPEVDIFDPTVLSAPLGVPSGSGSGSR